MGAAAAAAEYCKLWSVVPVVERGLPPEKQRK
jgi:hypothetical protein